MQAGGFLHFPDVTASQSLGGSVWRLVERRLESTQKEGERCVAKGEGDVKLQEFGSVA
jgi:hypothetical protein